MLSVLAEVSYLYLPFVLISALIRTSEAGEVPFTAFLLLGAIAGTLNWIMGRKPQRLLVLLVLNLGAACLAWWGCLAVLGLPGYGVSAMQWLRFDGPNIRGSLQVWLTLGLVVWVFLRTMVIYGRDIGFKEAMTRFEVSTGVVLGSGILMGILSVPLLQSVPAVIVCLLCNWAVLALTKADSVPPMYLAAGMLTLAGSVAALGHILQNLLPVMLTGSQILYDSAGPRLARLFVGALGWLFRKGHFGSNENQSTAQGSSSSGGGAGLHSPSLHNPHWMETLASVFIWTAAAVLVLVLAAGIIYLTVRLWKGRRTFALQDRGRSVRVTWLIRLKEALRGTFIFVRLFLPGKMEIGTLYSCLLFWGKHKKIPRGLDETPREYRDRLVAVFPGRSDAITEITESFVAFRYGLTSPDPEQSRELQTLARSLVWKSGECQGKRQLPVSS